MANIKQGGKKLGEGASGSVFTFGDVRFLMGKKTLMYHDNSLHQVSLFERIKKDNIVIKTFHSPELLEKEGKGFEHVLKVFSSPEDKNVTILHPDYKYLIIEPRLLGNKKIFPVYRKQTSNLSLAFEFGSHDILQHDLTLLTKSVLTFLDKLHSAGLCHFDIKPDNLFFIRNGDEITYAVGDYGFVDLFTSNFLSGTPAYLSPALYQYLPKNIMKHILHTYESLCKFLESKLTVQTCKIIPLDLESDKYKPYIDLNSLGIMLAEAFQSIDKFKVSRIENIAKAYTSYYNKHSHLIPIVYEMLHQKDEMTAKDLLTKLDQKDQRELIDDNVNLKQTIVIKDGVVSVIGEAQTQSLSELPYEDHDGGSHREKKPVRIILE